MPNRGHALVLAGFCFWLLPTEGHHLEQASEPRGWAWIMDGRGVEYNLQLPRDMPGEEGRAGLDLHGEIYHVVACPPRLQFISRHAPMARWLCAEVVCGQVGAKLETTGNLPESGRSLAENSRAYCSWCCTDPSPAVHVSHRCHPPMPPSMGAVAVDPDAAANCPWLGKDSKGGWTCTFSWGWR